MQPKELLQDDRAPSFFQIGDLSKLIAEKHCGMTIDDTSHQRWRELLGLLREFDTLVDDTAISHAEALAELDSFEAYKERYPHLSVEALPHEKRKALLGRTATILAIGDELQSTNNHDEFIELRVQEGFETAEFMVDSSSDEVLADPRFQTEFMPIMRSLGITACLLDSYSDAKRDYLHGKISIAPDKSFRLRLLKEAKRQSSPGLKSLRHGAIVKQFGVMSAVRLHNRIRHGVTPYSSLHNI